jgi:integrase
MIYANPPPTKHRGGITPSDNYSNYNPHLHPKSIVTPDHWLVAGPVVKAWVANMGFDTMKQSRLYLSAATAYTSWALIQGLALDDDVLLTDQAINMFCAQQGHRGKNLRSSLRRIARANGTFTLSSGPRYSKTPLKSPYSPKEIVALLNFADSHSSSHRSVSLKALLTLGAGCGLSRADLRSITAKSFHLHDDQLFVDAKSRCVSVLPDFVELANDIVLARPEGQLLGRRDGKDVTANICEWTSNRSEIPRLSSDRLRATYVVVLIESGVSILDLLAYTGMKKTDSLQSYLAFVTRRAPHCSIESPA